MYIHHMCIYHTPEFERWDHRRQKIGNMHGALNMQSLEIIYMYEQMREIDNTKKYYSKLIEIDLEQILPDTSYMWYL